MLFSYGNAFSPQTTTEMGAVALLEKEFAARNCNVLAIGLESRERMKSWKAEVDKTYTCDMQYPVINDTNGSILRLCCMLERPERFGPGTGAREGVMMADSGG